VVDDLTAGGRIAGRVKNGYIALFSSAKKVHKMLIP